MTILLIKAVDASHPDPEKDRRGCYKRGDVVGVYDDDHLFGAKEGLPRFVRLRIPDAAKALAVRLADEDDEDDNGQPAIDPEGNRRAHRRRRWQVAIASLPAAVRTALATTGEASITRAQISSRLRRKRDGAQFTDL